MKRMKINVANPDASKEPYAYFVRCKDDVAAWLERGFRIKTVWEAYNMAEPPFPGSYGVFCRYCAQHGLGRKTKLNSKRVPLLAARDAGTSRGADRANSQAPEVDIEKHRNRFDFGAKP